MIDAPSPSSTQTEQEGFHAKAQRGKTTTINDQHIGVSA
jgi:hypothetical protein